MSARFEIQVLSNGRFCVYDDYWDTCEVVTSDVAGVVGGAVKLVCETMQKGNSHNWFAVGQGGHSHIFEMPTYIEPIPGRHLRYRNKK